ncbi:MAG: acyloxyacyl hydrolase, partial [Verrucomicrobiae bacterium]|nr:acyloxyacyl hydrolase [Verrucomicrobiae bacterium]
LQLDDVSGDDFCGGIFRGYSEFFFRSMNMVYLHGYENHMNGMALGPRYNFVQPGWKIVPFVEGGVGFGFADSQGITEGGRQRGLGQDFNFMFSVAGGATYDFARDWFARLAFFYAHFSNAGQSQPERANNSIDAVGPELSFGYRF